MYSSWAVSKHALAVRPFIEQVHHQLTVISSRRNGIILVYTSLEFVVSVFVINAFFICTDRKDGWNARVVRNADVIKLYYSQINSPISVDSSCILNNLLTKKSITLSMLMLEGSSIHVSSRKDNQMLSRRMHKLHLYYGSSN